MQHAPHLDVRIVFDIENQVRVALQRPAKQPWQIQVVGVAGNARRWMASDMAVGVLQSIDETERRLFGVFRQVIIESVLDILPGKRSRDEGFAFRLHALRALARSDSK